MKQHIETLSHHHFTSTKGKAMKKAALELFTKFPNGITCYLETHFEIAQAIHAEMSKDKPEGLCAETQAIHGHAGLYALAEELADEFERLNTGREWDGEFYDEIDAFCIAKLNP